MKMKKIYIAPEMEVMEIENEVLMSMSAPNGGPGYGGEAGSSTENGSMEADANGRRGSWGNLWESESRSRW